VTLFQYANDGQGNLTLQQVAQINTPAQSGWSMAGNLSLKTGDLDGDGIDELALAHTEWRDSGKPQQLVLLNTYKAAVGADSQGNPQITGIAAAGAFQVQSIENDASDPQQRVRVQLDTGLFTYDPANGFDFGRRGIVVVFNSPNGDALTFWFANLSTDMSTVQPFAELVFDAEWFHGINQRFSIAAGDFRGVEDPQQPLWSVGVAVVNATAHPVVTSILDLTVPDLTFAANHDDLFPTDAWALPLLAYDYDGNSVFLGAPAHLTFEDNIVTDFVLYEPPKHTYYDNNPNSPTYGQIINVSRYDSFNVTLQDSTETTFSSTHTNTSNWTSRLRESL